LARTKVKNIQSGAATNPVLISGRFPGLQSLPANAKNQALILAVCNSIGVCRQKKSPGKPGLF
jgi:hypothetical protein